MRTLHIISTLNPAAGGPSEFVLSLLALSPSGDAPEVVTLDDPSAGYLQNLAYPVHALGPVQSVYAYSPKLLLWLKSNRARFDLFVVHGLWQYTGFSTALAAHKRVPYVVLPHGMLDPWFKHTYPSKHLKKWLYWLIAEYWVLRGANRVLFTTEEESRLAQQSFWLNRWRAKVIPFGTLPPPSAAAVQSEAFFNRMPDLRDKRFLLFLGRIHPKKGCDLLVEAFARIAEDDRELHLVVAGPDARNLTADLQSFAFKSGIASRVHWPGMISGDAKWGAFRATDAFILPSHQENFGIAVAEALACGCPVLLSDKINIAPEIAADGAGYVEPDTLQGTERLLRRWIATPTADRTAISQRARACFDRRYDLHRNAPEIHRILKAAAGIP